MSYLVLARKWRPQRFEEVIGQPHVVQTLQNAIAGRMIAHAYLFTGVRGVGKTSVARILAKALNCRKGPSPTPCNECEVCKEITAGESLDVLEIDGASNRGIEEIRELRENIKFLPARSPYKIYIIDEVHMLTGPAFNALLKTLEEPPAHVIFIFATTEPHRIPITILSRCQRFDFRRIALADMMAHLRHILKEEEVEISENSLRILAQQADGSLRDAQSLLEQLIAFSGKEISDSALLEVLGIIDRQALEDTATALIHGDAAHCLGIIDQLYRYGHDLRRFCQELAGYFRHMLVTKMSQQPEKLVDLTPDEMSVVQKQAEKVNIVTLQQFLHFLMRTEEDIRKAADPRLVLEMALLRLVQLPQVMDINKLITRMELLEKRLSREGGEPSGTKGQRKQAPHSPAGSSTERPAKVDALHEGEGPRVDWHHFLEHVRQQRPSLAAHLQRVQVSEPEPNNLVLDFGGHHFDYEMVSDSENLALLRSLVQDLYGRNVRITLKEESQEVRRSGRAQTDLQRQLHRQALKHPLVLEALEVFGGEIVEVRTDADIVKSG
ncbi:MAG: DNA polymerase III subunit gamma/tau [Deltaproteobacteria bacterium]|nr:DNA polymerase III subunit gamma/tau [Deltaproteobacteria bacterium]